PHMTSVPAHDGDTRTLILDAAQRRLLQYGYHKTTMAEIADDVGMSAANLYRYFASKEDIAAECASRCMNERLARLRVVAERPAGDVAAKLLDYALELIDDSHALAGTDSKIGELVATITRQRPALVHAKLTIHEQLLAHILAEGVAHGEFDVTDVADTARQLLGALMLFDVPLFVGLYPRAEFERRAQATVRLLLDGLRRR
ncbi:MAG: TetR/AcrR family transcriptional regulator, partial [Gammaproteobacteria bacterium]